MAGRDTMDVGSRAGERSGREGVSHPERIQLTAEERAILVDCRRHSMIRGFLSGAAFSFTFYWLKAQGRVPSSMVRHASIVYGLGFFATFVTGAGSYQKICFRRIMALENSALADLYKKTSSQIEENMKKHKEGSHSPSSMPKHMPKQRPQATPSTSDVSLKEGPSINMRTYSKDKSMLEGSEENVEQPSAFSSEGNLPPPPPSFPDSTREGDSEGSQRRKTFDEIREENRRRQSQPPRYPSSSSSSSEPKPERKRRNKYGDIIED